MKMYKRKKGNRRISRPGIQAKLEVGKKDDQFEKEADVIADGVVQMEGMENPGSMSLSEEEEQIQMKPIDNRESMMTPAGTTETEVIFENPKGQSGKQLDINHKAELEEAIGADFTNVRIHADKNSESMSQDLGAKAFTYKNHIFFNKDEYHPDTTEGRRLLAHELAHVVQQGAAKNNAVPTIQKQEVDRFGRSIVTSRSVLNHAGGTATGLGGGFLVGWAFDAMRESINSLPVIPVERQDIQSFFRQVSSGRRLSLMDVLRTRMKRHVRDYSVHRFALPFTVAERARLIDADLNVAQRIDRIDAFSNEFQAYHSETLESSYNIDRTMTFRPQLQENIRSASSLLGILDSGAVVTYMFYQVNMSPEEINDVQNKVGFYKEINIEALESLEQLQALYSSAISQNERTQRMIRRARLRARFSESPTRESNSPFVD